MAGVAVTALRGKTALITGGTAGIGLAIAQDFVRDGARVVINGRDAERGRRALATFGTRDHVRFSEADVTRGDAAGELVERTVAEYGRLDILVNNAGGARSVGPVADTSDEDWEYTLRWNLDAVFRASRAAVRHMAPRGTGRIITISSAAGKVPTPLLTAYCTAKHAVHGFTKSLAAEVGTDGITVNAICPALIRTDNLEEVARAYADRTGITPEQWISQWTSANALKRPVTAAGVAAMAVLLASDAGADITGSMLDVDGGVAPY
ncbi:SDR family NAD(P)-dependent oxidoreductase [Streptomyces sp. NPDC002054]|uniref:SDR family NAD(P)-dependent oxidoreductase n=1 Tax=Streptomyces sp. NPDC002054 TaxID=3154663 RepID=UPI00332BF938